MLFCKDKETTEKGEKRVTLHLKPMRIMLLKILVIKVRYNSLNIVHVCIICPNILVFFIAIML